MECPQYSIWLEAPGYLCASCLLPVFDAASVTWLNSRSSLAACDWLLSALSVKLSTRVRCRRKFGEDSCTACTGYGNDFELIPTAKMETRNPVDWSIGNEFPSIYNHCGVMAAWSCKALKKIHFFAFFRKTIPCGKFSKFCSERIHRLTDRRVVFKFREIWPTGNRQCRALFTWQKTKLPLALQLSLLRGLRSESSRASPRQFSECSKFHPNRFSLGWVIPERVNTIKTGRKLFPVFGWSLQLRAE